MLAVRVLKLDDEVTIFQVQSKALGRVLFDQVCNQLHLLEADYFGLEYEDINGCKYWLDLEKPMTRQVGLSIIDPYMRFCVKFYTPDPAQLEEEFTRYLFCLQIKRDLARGDIQCNDNTAAVLASYIVQAECGDFVQEDYPDHTYLSSFKFVPHQDGELERRIMENHRKLVGQSPAEADLNLLETARRCELFGMKMHPAKDHEGVPLNLAVAHMGIVVFQNYTKINTFSWAKIRKISFKRKRFLVKLLPEGYGYYKDTVEFLFDGRNECKNFWKKCVEHHGFFRCSQVKKVPRQKTRVLSRGSSFRYSGKTQKQMVEFVRENYIKRQTFQRDEGTASTPGDVWSQSFRHSSSVHSSVANVGGSISAHPLLPLGDNEVVGTQASLSCGSMTLNSMNETGPDSSEPRQQRYASQQRYRTTSLTTPPHAADADMDTSPECGASLTSSPQHYYARDRGPAGAEEDSPFHQAQQQRAGQPKHRRPVHTTTVPRSGRTCTASAQVHHKAPGPPGPSGPPGRQAQPGATQPKSRQHQAQQAQQVQQQQERNRSNSMNIEAIIIASVYSTDISNRGLSTSFTRLSSKSTTSVNTDVFNTDQSTASTIACDVHHTSAHELSRGDALRYHPNARPVPGIALIQASKDSADTDEIEGSDSDAAWSADSRGRGWNRSQASRGAVNASSSGYSSTQQTASQHINWQRSSSCKELHHDEVDSVEREGRDRGPAPSKPVSTCAPGTSFLFNSSMPSKTDAPVTRYDDSRRLCYSAAGSKTPSLDRGSGDVVALDQKVYSSSYPGTTSSLSTESEDAGLLESGHGGSIVVLSSDPCGSQEELALSHDDVSHGSYELLDREHDDHPSDQSKKRVGARSCSLGSADDGEIFIMDDDMEEGYESGKAGFGSSEGGPDWGGSLSAFHKRKSTGDIGYEMPTTRPDALRELIDYKREELKEHQQGESFSVSGMDGKKHFVIDRWGDYRMKVTEPNITSPIPRLPLVPFDCSDLPTGFEMPCTGEESDRKFKQIKESLKPAEKQEDDELALIKKYEKERKAQDRSSIDLGESKHKALDGKGRRSPRKDADNDLQDPTHMRTQIGRTRSDPHPGKGQNLGRLRRHMLMHQKSIDLPAEAEAKVEAKVEVAQTAVSSYVPATSKEKEAQGKPKSDIPYTLHKRHVMNGTAPETECKGKDVKSVSVKTGPVKPKPAPPPRGDTKLTSKPSHPAPPKKVPSEEEEDQTVPGSVPRRPSQKKPLTSASEKKSSTISSPPKSVELKSSSIQSPPTTKTASVSHGKQSPPGKQVISEKHSPPGKQSPPERHSPPEKAASQGKLSPPQKRPSSEKPVSQRKDSPPGKQVSVEKSAPAASSTSPPNKTKQTTSKQGSDKTVGPTKSPPLKSPPVGKANTTSSKSSGKTSGIKSPPNSGLAVKSVPVIPPKQKYGESPSVVRLNSTKPTTPEQLPSTDRKEDITPSEGTKISPLKSRISKEVGAPPLPIVKKRERSPVLFGRLGLSEGSAFTPVRGCSSPTSTRRTKSLDAPVVSVHCLPPADSFSSTDDTVDTNGEAKKVTTKPSLLKKPGPFSSGKECDASQESYVIMEVPDEDKSLSPACDTSAKIFIPDDSAIFSPEDFSPLRPDSPHPFAESYTEASAGEEDEKCEVVAMEDVDHLEIPESLPDLSPKEEVAPSDLPSADLEKGEGPSEEDDDWASVEENLADCNDELLESSKSETRITDEPQAGKSELAAGNRGQPIQIQPLPQESLDDPFEYARRKMSIEGKPIPQDSLDDVFDGNSCKISLSNRSLPVELDHLRRKMSIEGKPIPIDPEMDVPTARAKLLSTHMESIDLPSPDFPPPDLLSPDLPLVDCQPYDVPLMPEDDISQSKTAAPDDYESPDYASPYVQSPEYASPYMQSPVNQSPKHHPSKIGEDCKSNNIAADFPVILHTSDIKEVALEFPEENKDDDYEDDNVFEDDISHDEDLSKEFDMSEESLSKTGDTAQHLLSQDSQGKDMSDEPTYVDPITLNADDADDKTLSVSLEKESFKPDIVKVDEDDDVPPAIPEKPLCLRKPLIAKKPDIPKKPFVLRKLQPQYPELEKPPQTPEKDYMTDEKPPIKSKPAVTKPARLNIVRQNSQEKSDSEAFFKTEEKGLNEKVKIFVQGASTDRSPDKVKEDTLSRSRHGSSEDASTSSGVRHMGEKSSTWRPFLLESSGSSSLEEGLFPPDDSAHAGDEDDPSSTSNARDDEVADIPSGFGYPCMGSSLTMSGADLMGGYGSVYALSRTLSRISERSTTSEQERSDLEDIEDSTKPSSRSPSLGDESMMSSDHQPSLSSDPPSGTCELMPEDGNFEITAKSLGTPDGADLSCTLVPPRLVVPATSRSASEGLSDFEFGELPEIPADPAPMSKDDSTPTAEQRDYLDPPGISRYASMESGLDKIPGMSPVTEEAIPEDESDPDLEFHELPALPDENGEGHEEALSPEVLAAVIPPPKLSKDSSQSDLPSPEDPVKVFVEGNIPEELIGHIPPPLLPSTSEENNWPTPPSSSPLPVACNVETYNAGKPEEARKVTVTSSLDSNDPPDDIREELSFSDETENPTMQEEEVFDEPLTPSSLSYETLVTVRSRDPSAPRGSTGEDTSMALSEWSSSTSTMRQQSTFPSASSQSGKSAHSGQSAHSHSAHSHSAHSHSAHSGHSSHSAHSAHSANSIHSAHSTHSLHSAHSTHSLSQATSFSQLQQLSQLSQSQATLHSQIQGQSFADLAKDDTSIGASVSESARASSDDVFLTDYGSASSSEQQECVQGAYISSAYLKTARSQSERSHRSSNYETFHENLYDDDPFIAQTILSPTEQRQMKMPSFPLSHSPTDEPDRSTLSRKRRSKKASSYDVSPKSPSAFAGEQGFEMDPYSKQRSRSIPIKSKTSYFGNVASPPSSEDESAAARKQALKKSLERPKSGSRNRTNSKSKERHSSRSDRSRSRAPHHARSPPSDYSSSSSDNGSAQRASNTIPRVSRRRKQYPTRRRSRAAAEEARDGRLHGISSAVSTPSVLAYGDPSSHFRRRDRREPPGKNGGDQANVTSKQGGLSKQSSV